MNPLLLVDDSPVMRALVLRVVRDAGLETEAHTGLEVLEADSSTAALTALRRAAGVPLVLCDTGMPGLGGIELVRALRRERPAGAAFVVAMTNVGDRATAERASAAGADAVVERPFDARTLTRVVEPWSRARRAADHARIAS